MAANYLHWNTSIYYYNGNRPSLSCFINPKHPLSNHITCTLQLKAAEESHCRIWISRDKSQGRQLKEGEAQQIFSYRSVPYTGARQSRYRQDQTYSPQPEKGLKISCK